MNPQRKPSAILKLEPNVPTELALQYANGMDVTGNYGPQVLFTLKGNRRLYVPLEVGKEIRSLSLAPGQPFIVTKVKREGQRSFNWVVERKYEPQNAPQAPGGPDTTEPAKSFTRVESALKTAIAAACAAERFGVEIGYPVKFSADSIKSLAVTVLIETGRAA